MKIIEYNYPVPNYNAIKKLEPIDECIVSVYNKNINCYENKPIFRKYKSFGVSPSFKETGKSFMFNHQMSEIPKELVPYITFSKYFNNLYNNCYVNWYDNGSNYIEPHSDCTNQLVPNSMIIIINLNEGNYERTFKIQHKNGGDIRAIKLTHGKCLMFNSKEQESYRHWIDQEDTQEGRISITLRMITL